MSKPLLTKDQILFWFHRFRKYNTHRLDHKRRLIDSFINTIYLYDDKMVITFNYKDGAKTISLNEIENSDLSSDLTASALPVENGSTMRFWAVFLLLFKLGTRSVLPHFDTQNGWGFPIRRHTLTTVPSATSSIKHQNFSSDWISAGAFLCLLRYKFWLKSQSPRLYR